MNYLSGSFLRRRLLSGSAWASGGRVGGAMLGIVTNGLLDAHAPPQELDAYFLALSIVSLGAVVGSLGLPKDSGALGRREHGTWTAPVAHVGRSAGVGLGVLGTLGVSLAYLLVGDFVGITLLKLSVSWRSPG